MKNLTFFLLVFLTACAPALPTPPQAAPPTFWQVQVTPALAWLVPTINRCAAEQPAVNLVLLERPTSALDLASADIILRWGAPSALAAPAAILGEDELVFIVHPTNPLNQLSAADLASLLTGKTTTWEKLSPGAAKDPLKVFFYPAGEDPQQVLEKNLPDLTPNRETGWLAPDPAAARQAVAANPTALGFIPRRWLDASVKALAISGLTASTLRQPILAITPKAQTDSQKAWLTCLQTAFK
jgi:hypothetical protein